MNGLVRLAHYDPRWSQEFEQTRSGVLQASEGWVTAVEHIGSTAIPGTIARPILDLVAGVLDANCIAPATDRLLGLNYRKHPLPAWADEPGCVLCKPRRGEPTHRIFLTLFDGPLWRRVVQVRDRLRANGCERHRFEDAKVHRWRCSEGSVSFYENGKAVFFSHLEDQITAAARR